MAAPTNPPAASEAPPAPESAATTTTTTAPTTQPTATATHEPLEKFPDLPRNSTEANPAGDSRPLPSQSTAATSSPADGKEQTEKGTTPRQSEQASDNVNPPDFQGEVLTDNKIPPIETIHKIENYIVLDRHGKTHTFKSLYSGRNSARRVLVIFVRHFFCGNCQEYLRALSHSITTDALLRLPISTFIVVVGCGDPALIDMYASETGCPFPIYADPTRKLYQELGMVKTLALGQRPAYMSKSLLKSSLDSVVQGLKQIKNGLATKAGDQRQIGGEFLFEPLDLRSPDASPVVEHNRRLGQAPNLEKPATGAGPTSAPAAETARASGSSFHDDEEDNGFVEEKKVTWCHRMKTTRDHAEIPELMEILGLDGQGRPTINKDNKRWSKALESRKGTGLSMASQMSQMNRYKIDEGT